MQRGADGPKNTLNGLVRIGIKFYSQMSVPYAFNQTTVGDMFGGNLVRLNILETLSSECSKVAVPCCFGVALCGTDVRHGWSWKALKRLYDRGITSSVSAEFVLMDENSRPHRAHLVKEFLHDNNIARLEWPACSPDMNPIEHAWDTLKRAVFGRIHPSTTLRDLRRIAVEE